VPGPLSADKIPGAGAVPQTFSHRLMAQEPIKTSSGTVRISDSRNFPVNTTTAAALVEVKPGGLREMHWHPNADEWQYWVKGKGRMTVFNTGPEAVTLDFNPGDIGYVKRSNGHYIKNVGEPTWCFSRFSEALTMPMRRCQTG
jgi:oxalate decarboxylase